MNKFHDLVKIYKIVVCIYLHPGTYTAKYIHAKFVISDSNQRPKMKSHKMD